MRIGSWRFVVLIHMLVDVVGKRDYGPWIIAYPDGGAQVSFELRRLWPKMSCYGSSAARRKRARSHGACQRKKPWNRPLAASDHACVVDDSSSVAAGTQLQPAGYWEEIPYLMMPNGQVEIEG